MRHIFVVFRVWILLFHSFFPVCQPIIDLFLLFVFFLSFSLHFDCSILVSVNCPCMIRNLKIRGSWILKHAFKFYFWLIFLFLLFFSFFLLFFGLFLVFLFFLSLTVMFQLQINLFWLQKLLDLLDLHTLDSHLLDEICEFFVILDSKSFLELFSKFFVL